MFTIAGGVALGIILVPVVLTLLYGMFIAVFTGSVVAMCTIVAIDERINKK